MWLSSIITYLTCNVVFSVLIHLLCDGGENPNIVLVVLRVATLDGLFLIMGITLAVCILIVSICPYSMCIYTVTAYAVQ